MSYTLNDCYLYFKLDRIELSMLTYCPLVAKYTTHIRKTNIYTYIYIYLFSFTLLANKCESSDTPCGGNLTLRYTIITFIITAS